MTNYPEAVENTLNHIVQSVQETNNNKYPMHEVFIREVFGEVLFEHWLTGSDEAPMEEEQFEKLMKLVVAKSMVQELQDNGLIDCVDDGDGNEFVFITEKGKQEHYDFNLN